MGFHGIYPLVMTGIDIEPVHRIVSFPIRNGVFSHSHVALPVDPRVSSSVSPTHRVPDRPS